MSGDLRRHRRAGDRAARPEFGLGVLVAMVVAGCIAAAVGALVALPALRLGGIFLSLATFAFALFFDSVMVK